MKTKKVIIDTNIWISFLITKNFDELDELIDNKVIRLIFSKELIEEFVSVAKRPKLSKYFPPELIEELINTFEEYGKLVKVTSEFNERKDPKDNFLLNLAIDSKADYLLSGDNDLLSMKKINKTKIVTWSEFLQELKQ